MLLGDAKWGAFAACEAFVLPSHQENFGIAVVEAIASARPALLTHPVNIAPDLEAEGCALVDTDTEVGVHHLLTRWLALSSSEREQMSARAYTTFLHHYDMRSNAEAILRVFEQLTPLPTPHSSPLPEAR
jgi:glycosyltransferase involved in cell wall biosynthesis